LSVESCLMAEQCVLDMKGVPARITHSKFHSRFLLRNLWDPKYGQAFTLYIVSNADNLLLTFPASI
jgi:hypothetical protein